MGLNWGLFRVWSENVCLCVCVGVLLLNTLASPSTRALFADTSLPSTATRSTTPHTHVHVMWGQKTRVRACGCISETFLDNIICVCACIFIHPHSRTDTDQPASAASVSLVCLCVTCPWCNVSLCDVCVQVCMPRQGGSCCTRESRDPSVGTRVREREREERKSFERD